MKEVFEFEKRQNIPAFLVQRASLLHIEQTTQKYFKHLQVDKENLVLNASLSVVYENGSTVTSADISELIKELEASLNRIEKIRLEYRISSLSEYRISILSSAGFSIVGFGPSETFKYYMTEIEDNLCEVQPSQGSLTKLLFSKPNATVLSWLIFAILAISLVIAISSGLLLSVAYSIGVNIDKSHIPSGNDIFREIDSAITSDDLSVKLNALLRDKLTGFTNVDDFIGGALHTVRLSAVIFGLTAVLLVIFRKVSAFYRKTYFEFGTRIERNRSARANRDLLVVGVILSFVVNVTSTVFLTVLPQLLKSNI